MAKGIDTIVPVHATLGIATTGMTSQKIAPPAELGRATSASATAGVIPSEMRLPAGLGGATCVAKCPSYWNAFDSFKLLCLDYSKNGGSPNPSSEAFNTTEAKTKACSDVSKFEHCAKGQDECKDVLRHFWWSKDDKDVLKFNVNETYAMLCGGGSSLAAILATIAAVLVLLAIAFISWRKSRAAQVRAQLMTPSESEASQATAEFATSQVQLQSYASPESQVRPDFMMPPATPSEIYTSPRSQARADFTMPPATPQGSYTSPESQRSQPRADFMMSSAGSYEEPGSQSKESKGSSDRPFEIK